MVSGTERGGRGGCQRYMVLVPELNDSGIACWVLDMMGIEVVVLGDHGGCLWSRM